MSVYVFGITLGSFGIHLAITRLVSEELAIGNKESARRIAKRCIAIRFICGMMEAFCFFYGEILL